MTIQPIILYLIRNLFFSYLLRQLHNLIYPRLLADALEHLDDLVEDDLALHVMSYHHDVDDHRPMVGLFYLLDLLYPDIVDGIGYLST